MSAAPFPYALDPFGPLSNPELYVPCKASERARGRMERTLSAGRIPALLGPPGHGKTLLLRLAGQDTRGTEAVYVPMCTLDSEDFFSLVLGLLSEPEATEPPAQGRGAGRKHPARARLRAAVERRAPRGGILLLIDDANGMPDDTANALASMRIATGGALRIALAAIDGPAARRVCDAFGRDVQIVPVADGLSRKEAHRYIESRLAQSGANPELLAAFDRATVGEIHKKSRGVPRIVNEAAEIVLRSAWFQLAPDASARSTPARRAPQRVPEPRSARTDRPEPEAATAATPTRAEPRPVEAPASAEPQPTTAPASAEPQPTTAPASAEPQPTTAPTSAEPARKRSSRRRSKTGRFERVPVPTPAVARTPDAPARVEPEPSPTPGVAETATTPGPSGVEPAATPEPDVAETAAKTAPEPDVAETAAKTALEPDVAETAAKTAPEPDVAEPVVKTAPDPRPAAEQSAPKRTKPAARRRKRRKAGAKKTTGVRAAGAKPAGPKPTPAPDVAGPAEPKPPPVAESASTAAVPPPETVEPTSPAPKTVAVDPKDAAPKTVAVEPKDAAPKTEAVESKDAAPPEAPEPRTPAAVPVAAEPEPADTPPVAAGPENPDTPPVAAGPETPDTPPVAAGPETPDTPPVDAEPEPAEAEPTPVRVPAVQAVPSLPSRPDEPLHPGDGLAAAVAAAEERNALRRAGRPGPSRVGRPRVGERPGLRPSRTASSEPDPGEAPDVVGASDPRRTSGARAAGVRPRPRSDRAKRQFEGVAASRRIHEITPAPDPRREAQRQLARVVSMGFAIGLLVSVVWFVGNEVAERAFARPTASEEVVRRWAPQAGSDELPQVAAAPPAEHRAAPRRTPAPQPPAAVAAPAARSVSVSINAVPWAAIEVDGRDLGTTPLAGIALSAGSHEFRAHMPDGRILERRVEITPDRRTVVFR